MHFENQTLRQIVHTSIGGPQARLVLSNVFGTAPLTVGGVHVALRDKGSAIVPASVRTVTFSNRSTFTIPAGAVLVSDPIALAVQAAGDIAVDLYLPGNTNTPSPLTMHNGALQTNYVSETQNYAGATAPPVVVTSPNQLLLAFAASDGPADGPQTIAISGGGLNWTLVRRSNSQGGTSEIWSAVAPNAGASVAATSAMTVPGHQSLAVVTLKGTAAVGATASASASSGAPAATLSTTSAGSWVFAVGNDWDHALPRALGPNQTMVHQWVDDPVNDTFWSQATSAAIPNAGRQRRKNWAPGWCSSTSPTTPR